MASVLASESDQPGHQHKQCDACLRDDAFSSATKWCRDCKEALCAEFCYIAHRRNKATTNHTVISMEDVTEQEISASKLDIDINCKNHKGKPYELYCRTHRTFCCTLCAFTNHQECKTMIPLEDLSKECLERKSREKQTSVYLDILKKVQRFMEDKSSCLRHLDIDKVSILTKTADTVKQTKDKLDQLYSDFERNVIKEHKSIKQSQERTMELLTGFQNKVKGNTSTMETLCHVTPNESLVMTETLKVDTLELCQQLEEKLQQDTNTRIKFKLDSTMQSLINNCLSLGDVDQESYNSESSLGISSIQEAINGLDIGMMIGTQAQYPVRPKKDLMKADVKLVKVVAFRDLDLERGQESPWFTDGKFTDLDDIVLVDFNNSRLVLFDSDMKVKREIKVNGQPSCLDISDDEKLVHVVCDRNSVHHYSLQGGEEEDRRKKVGDTAWGIVVNGGTTTISYIDKKIVQYDMKGNTIKSVATNALDPYIAVSNNGEQIYYHRGNTIIACDRELNEKWRYTCNCMGHPSGIGVDFYDNVYIVGRSSKNVHQISGDGSRHRVLVQRFNKITKPLAIAFNKNKDMFVVTTMKEEDVAFEMYEFVS